MSILKIVTADMGLRGSIPIFILTFADV